MHGNVWEWVEDCVHNNYNSAPEDGSVWTADGDCSSRVVRGGGWNVDPLFFRSAGRGGNTAGARNINLGIRLGRTLGP
jgi:formylglycine-generating enzyme required for sulfatase activity